MIQYIKMPAPLLVLGVFYGIVAAFYLYSFIKTGYWTGMMQSLRLTFRYNPKRILAASVIVGIMILFIDLPVALLSKNYYNPDFYKIVDFINQTGEGWFIGGVVFSLFMIFQFLGKEKMAIVAKISFMSAIYSGLFNAVIKFVFNRERPGIGMNPWHFFHFFATGANRYSGLFYAYNSMPSGHTVTIFAAITPFFLTVKSAKIKLCLIIMALLICFARIYTLNHWLSDVFIAALFGMIIGRAMLLGNQYRYEGLNVKS